MKRIHVILLVISASIIPVHSCMPRIGIDLIATKVLKNNPSNVKEAVAFSIGQTYNAQLRRFAAADITDKEMRSKVQSIGQKIYVNYQNDDAPTTIPDSVVVFTSSFDFGTIDVIYDFATNERSLLQVFSKERSSYLQKVNERTYYRRGQSSLLN